ncbi:MAG: PIN domain-containing protein [Desulfurococcales archaeon]|nr:PIN domain-containing protein [Desulfurococcales archaeon]
MSKKGFQGEDNKLLLDTSFLLPILGFETSGRIMRAFRKLGRYELYYSDLSILEALWKILKVVRGLDEEVSRIEEGVTAIKETMKHAPVDGEAVRSAIRMYMMGHRDMIDNLLLSIAASRGLKLLTVDEDLIDFAKRHGLARDAIAAPEDLG